MLQMIENSETHNITLFVLILAILSMLGLMAFGVIITITHHNKKKKSAEDSN
ncbi:MAG: hypothetical protein ACHQET_02365 [Chitinophagales bacterium]